MKKCLNLFFRFCLLCFYIIDICVLLIYILLVFTQYSLKAGLSMMLFYPAKSAFFTFLFAIFVAGTFLIYKKSSNSNRQQNVSGGKPRNKYKTTQRLIKYFIVCLIVLFYILDIPSILTFSFFIVEEIRTLNAPDPLPSSLNMGIKSILKYWIIYIIPFIAITVLIVKNSKKKR